MLNESTSEGRRALELTIESGVGGGDSNTLAVEEDLDFGNGAIGRTTFLRIEEDAR